jgi:hypothetical protein
VIHLSEVKLRVRPGSAALYHAKRTAGPHDGARRTFSIIMFRMKRFVLPALMNLLVPGSGLMALGRPWLGLALAVWYAMSAEALIAAKLIAPGSLPAWTAAVGGGLAALAWIIAQGLLGERIRFLMDVHLPTELAMVRKMAEDALQRADYRAARSALRVALTMDDSDVMTRILWARLMSVRATRFRARRAWIEAARLDQRREFTTEIRAALRQLRAV